jgi:hypothetical protein
MGTKIVDLPQVTNVLGDDIFVISQLTPASPAPIRTTYKISLNQIQTFITTALGPVGNGTVQNVTLTSNDNSIKITNPTITTAGTINLEIKSVSASLIDWVNSKLNLQFLSSNNATTGQILAYDGNTNTWRPSSINAIIPSGGIPSPAGATDGQYLVYQASTNAWISKTVDLTNLIINPTYKVDGQFLMYQASTNSWISKTVDLSLSQISNIVSNSLILEPSHVGKILKIKGVSSNITYVLSNTTITDIPIGSKVTIVQDGDYNIQLSATNSVTLNSLFNKKITSGNNALVNIVKTGNNIWNAYGDLDNSIDDYTHYTIDYGFKFNILIKNSANFTSSVIDIIIDAVNKLARILKYTKVPMVGHPSTMTDGVNLLENPFFGKQLDGILIVIDKQTLSDPDTIGYAGTWAVRNSPNFKYHRLPAVSYFVLNETNLASQLDVVSDLGVTKLYYTIVHELLHALGIGSEWHVFNSSTSKIRRSFVVGAEDNSVNIHGNTLANIFYSINRGNNSRTENDTGTFLLSGVYNKGDASFKYAYNPFTPIGNTSKAVTYYNDTFNTNLTAIPLENMMGIGSYGVHWLEGIGDLNKYNNTTNVADITGTDNRTYYAVLNPGAPAMYEEMMTPMSENTFDAPISKITLGALEDLGWVVDYNESDTYSPNLIEMKLVSGEAYIRKNGFGGWVKVTDSSGTYTLFIRPALRRGRTYTVSTPTVGKIVRVNRIQGSTVTLIGNSTSTNPSVTFTVPTTYALTDIIEIIADTTALTKKVEFLIGG